MPTLSTNRRPAESPASPPADQGAGTRRRLLDTAARLFAERGYRDVAIRDICERACTNIASVNYHFGSKQKLHRAAIDHARERALQQMASQPATRGANTPEGKLRKHLRCTIGRAFEQGPASWYVRIVLRELAEPTAALKQTIDEHIAPPQRKLEGIIAQVLNEDPDSERAKDIASSLLATTVYFHNCPAAIEHLRPGFSFDASTADRLIDTLTAMVVGAAA